MKFAELKSKLGGVKLISFLQLLCQVVLLSIRKLARMRQDKEWEEERNHGKVLKCRKSPTAVKVMI